VADVNTIQMQTGQVCLWAENPGVGVGQWVAETIGIWPKNGGKTTQWKDSTVRECVSEFFHSMSIGNKLGAALA
jgi:hypothetical protein